MEFFISDYHIGHENVLRLDNRPFGSMSEMVNTIVTNWNNVVKRRDDVYILGDFIMDKSYLPLINMLNGRKHIILGNHDVKAQYLAPYVIDIAEYKELRVNHQKIVLSHTPIAHWNGQYRGTYHLFGHIHNNTKDTKMMLFYRQLTKAMGVHYNAYNVGCMLPYMNYTPQTLESIVINGEAYYKSKETVFTSIETQRIAEYLNNVM